MNSSLFTAIACMIYMAAAMDQVPKKSQGFLPKEKPVDQRTGGFLRPGASPKADRFSPREQDFVERRSGELQRASSRPNPPRREKTNVFEDALKDIKSAQQKELKQHRELQQVRARSADNPVLDKRPRPFAPEPQIVTKRRRLDSEEERIQVEVRRPDTPEDVLRKLTYDFRLPPPPIGSPLYSPHEMSPEEQTEVDEAIGKMRPLHPQELASAAGFEQRKRRPRSISYSTRKFKQDEARKSRERRRYHQDLPREPRFQIDVEEAPFRQRTVSFDSPLVSGTRLFNPAAKKWDEPFYNFNLDMEPGKSIIREEENLEMIIQEQPTCTYEEINWLPMHPNPPLHGPAEARIVIFNLDTTKAPQLCQHFSLYGPINHITVYSSPQTDQGQPGLAFIEFLNVASAQRAADVWPHTEDLSLGRFGAVDLCPGAYVPEDHWVVVEFRSFKQSDIPPDAPQIDLHELLKQGNELRIAAFKRYQSKRFWKSQETPIFHISSKDNFMSSFKVYFHRVADARRAAEFLVSQGFTVTK